jgi:hypothetical protein
MSIESDAKYLTFNQYKKKYGYKYINVWIAENMVDIDRLINSKKPNENET